MTAIFTEAELIDIRNDFPILQVMAHDQPVAYLDNAATSQKPKCTIDAISQYYETYNANVHRGVHYLSDKATNAYEDARETVREFINAQHREEIIFVRGTTEAINLVANSYGRSTLTTGDEIIISSLEHHSNLVPWQLIAEQTGAIIKVAPINDKTELLIDELKALINPKTKLLALTHISNAMGTINPVKEIIDYCKQHQVTTVIDGAQAAPHLAIDVQALDCDFYAFSGHKAFGPTGIGVLYGKQALLNAMPPYHGGGEMICQVSFEKSTYRKVPMRFEAGTPNIAGAIGFATSIKYIKAIGLDRITAREQRLLAYAKQQLATLPNVKLAGNADNMASVLSFTHAKAHPHDIATILDQAGIAVRAGHHCAMPLMNLLGLPATVRASLCFYNTFEEIDRLIAGLHTVEEFFK